MLILPYLPYMYCGERAAMPGGGGGGYTRRKLDTLNYTNMAKTGRSDRPWGSWADAINCGGPSRDPTSFARK